jgi:hypothetical protein
VALAARAHLAARGESVDLAEPVFLAARAARVVLAARTVLVAPADPMPLQHPILLEPAPKAAATCGPTTVFLVR